MTEQFAVYKCDVCGNIVELLYGTHDGLVCCGKPMQRLTENTVDAAKEKHGPVIEACDGGCKVKVGSAPHPMEEKHWIQFIEIITREGCRCVKTLKPGEAPEAKFSVTPDEVACAREYCNLHGLWRS